ncbi:hypothetical protein PV387_39405 [Streptomyces sp. ME02-6987-2C]|uniref:hypothetical protein n=1 Tax=unclassified Streptomyces TaxID=2593676 RepID=UPI0029AD65C4|nr:MULTISPECIES: hypothetical protein [unclassified Streptomyces]MDX3345936.1 hypothetical protein [Streptomyces sp. ME02-6979A]MDX3371986.1 hypothetical protein [Streptomyces sp. ME02-6987-2C]MDX3412204.1 hypothetical protein [Streptomyces sp. ME02-6977A]MDX3421702.1 hypothetical protein [Streptomyces sp. ME02-6985-2c]
MHELRTILADWPDLPKEADCVPDDLPMTPAQWPALAPVWRDVQAILDVDRNTGTGFIATGLLYAEGAIAPLATAGVGTVPGARYERGWLWRCGVHVMADGQEPARDCTENSRSTTADGAREAALRHVLAEHPDAAVPYLARRWHALRTWN